MRTREQHEQYRRQTGQGGDTRTGQQNNQQSERNWGFFRDLAKFAQSYQDGTYVVSVGSGRDTLDYTMTVMGGRIESLCPIKSQKQTANFRVELISNTILQPREEQSNQINHQHGQQSDRQPDRQWDREQQFNRTAAGAPAGTLA